MLDSCVVAEVTTVAKGSEAVVPLDAELILDALVGVLLGAGVCDAVAGEALIDCEVLGEDEAVAAPAVVAVLGAILAAGLLTDATLDVDADDEAGIEAAPLSAGELAGDTVKVCAVPAVGVEAMIGLTDAFA